MDILEVIGNATTLKKVANINGRGAELEGSCPFCGGKDRFRVQPDMGLWWCRQCSENEHWGNAADYVMKRDSVDFKEAMRRLGLWQEPDTWDYHDKDGTVIYQVVRFEKEGEKKYYQRVPDDRGGWKNGLNGTAPTIYHLPEVLRAAGNGETIYIAEGEKCVDALKRVGLIATTNSGGAGKWKPEYSNFLKGASAVIVCADNDTVGLDHARNVALHTHRVVSDVRIVTFPELPPAADVSDWLALGHSKDELVARASNQQVIPATEAPPAKHAELINAPSLPIDVNDLLAMERKPTIWFAQGFLREGLGLLVGQPNVGKTPLAVQLAIAGATGTKWMGAVQMPQCKVLYLGVEYSAQELIPLFDISRCGQKIPRDYLLVKTIEDEFPTTPEEAIAELEWYIRVMGVQIIIIDVLTAFLPPEKFKQNVYRGDYSELKPYHKLALQYNAAILGTWHGSKREADPKIMYNGSTGMWAAAASRITMYTDQEQRIRIASFPRMGDKVDWALAQERTLTGHRWVVADAAPEPMMAPTEAAIWRFLKAHGDKANPKTPSTIADMTSIPIGTVKSALSRMFDKNLIQQSRAGSGYYYEAPATLATVATNETVATLATPLYSEWVANATQMQPKETASESAKTNGLQGLQPDGLQPDLDPEASRLFAEERKRMLGK